MKPVNYRPSAIADLEAVALYYPDSTFDRFAAALQTVERKLGRNGRLGATVLGRSHVRWLPIPRFPYAAFYRVRSDDIIVLRILHHARDLAKVLNDQRD